jgi:DNA polymerase III subunit delta
MQSIGDVSASTIDAVVEAVIAGDLAATDTAFAKLAAGKQPVSLVLAALIRQLQALSHMREAIELSGKSIGDVVAAARPPLWGARRTMVELGLARWPLAFIARSLARLADVTLEARRRATLEDEIIRQALLGLTSEARRNAQSARN